MITSVIVAIGKNLEIGLDNELLWRLSKDLLMFKKLTTGHHIVMGRKTFESIGRPLPNRTTIILSRNPNYQVDGCITASSIDEAIETAKRANESELFICGGEAIYTEGLKICDKLYISKVDFSGDADAFFPPFDHIPWNVLSSSKFLKDEKNEFDFEFFELERG